MFDDLTSYGEPESRAFGCSHAAFRRPVKFIENRFEVMLGYAHAGVGNVDYDLRTGGRRRGLPLSRSRFRRPWA